MGENAHEVGVPRIAQRLGELEPQAAHPRRGRGVIRLEYAESAYPADTRAALARRRRHRQHGFGGGVRLSILKRGLRCS